MTNNRHDFSNLTPVEIEAQRCSIVAWDNYCVADHLLAADPVNISFVPSAIVVRALAVELMIKAGLLVEKGKFKHVHDYH